MPKQELGASLPGRRLKHKIAREIGSLRGVEDHWIEHEDGDSQISGYRLIQAKSAAEGYRTTHARKKNQIDVISAPAAPKAFEFNAAVCSCGSSALITHDESRWPVQAATVPVSLQKCVSAELEKVTSILETKIPDNLF